MQFLSPGLGHWKCLIWNASWTPILYTRISKHPTFLLRWFSHHLTWPKQCQGCYSTCSSMCLSCLGFSIINDSTSSRGDKSSIIYQQNIITISTSPLISIQKLSYFMLSPILFTSIPFEPIVLPKDIYEISLYYLEQSLDLVSALAYKKTANRIKLVTTTLPEDFQIIWRIPTDPLETLPEISFNLPNFSPGERYTLERKSTMNVVTPQVNFPWKITFDMLYTNEFVIRVCSRVLSISSKCTTI